ncbi:hypothetical protein C8Q76DRAFT_697856 [Earliella scabrosa]|nr:hypothetical protein C8Q76DRAFT_697856 [Earliella scabrosa]
MLRLSLTLSGLAAAFAPSRAWLRCVRRGPKDGDRAEMSAVVATAFAKARASAGQWAQVSRACQVHGGGTGAHRKTEAQGDGQTVARRGSQVHVGLPIVDIPSSYYDYPCCIAPKLKTSTTVRPGGWDRRFEMQTQSGRTRSWIEESLGRCGVRRSPIRARKEDASTDRDRPWVYWQERPRGAIVDAVAACEHSPSRPTEEPLGTQIGHTRSSEQTRVGGVPLGSCSALEQNGSGRSSTRGSPSYPQHPLAGLCAVPSL